MEKTDVIWAQNVIERWSTEKAIPAPRVRMTSRMKQRMLGRYKDNTISLYQKAWREDDLLGKILVLAHEFGHHIQHTSGLEFDDDNASELGRELVDLELQKLAEVRGVTVAGLMKMKEINDPEVW
jgi:hypothetical protein